MATNSFLCNGRFCSYKKLCKHYIENADISQNSSIILIDRSNQLKASFRKQGYIKTEPICGDDSKYYYFQLIQNYNN